MSFSAVAMGSGRRRGMRRAISGWSCLAAGCGKTASIEEGTGASTGAYPQFTGNREIASQLFLSIRTVNNHLNHVYAKLGFNDRDDLATALDLPE